MGERSGEYSCIFLPELAGRTNIQVKGELGRPLAHPGWGWCCPPARQGRLRRQQAWAQAPALPGLPLGPPNIKAVKKSEHATEREMVVLGCKSDSFPPVSEWVWYKMENSGEVRDDRTGDRLALASASASAPTRSACPQVISNSSQSKYLVISSETKTELHIADLDLEADPGSYVCNGTSPEGTGQAIVVLRVRNRFAALWPFLGIVAEVLVLVTVIFIYEKRRKPDEVLDGEPHAFRSCRPGVGGAAVQQLRTEEGAVGLGSPAGGLWPLSRGCQWVGVPRCSPCRQAVAASWFLTWRRLQAARATSRGRGCGGRCDATSDGLSSPRMWLHTGTDEDAGAAPL